MEKQNLKPETDKEQLTEILDAFRAITVNVLMNSYTTENVALGLLQPNERIPFDRYVDELSLQAYKPYAFKESIEGNAITSDGTVAALDWSSFALESFVLKMNAIFMTAPHKDDYNENGLLLFKYGLGDFIMSLFPLYTEILQTEVEYGVFALVPDFTTKAQEGDFFGKINKFLVTMKVKKLRQGGYVDRYIKSLPHIPYFVQRLLKVHKNRYLLANSDTNSLDYKLAVLTAAQFMNPEHTKLFELKAKQWLKNLAQKRISAPADH